MPQSFEDKYEKPLELGTVFDNRLNDLKSEIKIQLPCKVQSVDFANNQVSVQILDYDFDNLGNIIPYPIIPNVPIREPLDSANAYIRLPIQVGDVGTIEFFDSSVADLLATGNFDYDYTEEWHSLNNGLFTNGFLPKNKLFSFDYNNDIIMGLKSGETTLSFRGFAYISEILPNFNPNNFDTELTESEEQEYQIWRADMINKGLIVFDNYPEFDYDFRGAWKDGLYPEDKSGHWRDTYKKPNHPTFSVESKYATGEYLQYAGTWTGEKFNMPQSREVPVINIENNSGNVIINANRIVTNSSIVEVNVEDQVLINGDVNVSGNITATGEITAGTVALTQHTHPYTWTDGAGSGNTSAPNA